MGRGALDVEAMDNDQLIDTLIDRCRTIAIYQFRRHPVGNLRNDVQDMRMELLKRLST